MSDKPQVDENTLRTMQELPREPPKPHDEMKLGKPRGKKGRESQEASAQIKGKIAGALPE